MIDDLISRQAAIDIVEFECGEWSGLARTIVKAIKRLPSAQEKPFNLPEIYIAEGYDTIEGEDGNVGFGVYVPDETKIYVAGDVEGEIRARALFHEVCHWVQAMCGRPFDEDEANEFSDIVYDALPSAQPDNDRIWEALSTVYNMADVPDEAKAIIGDVMLGLDEPSAQPERRSFSCGQENDMISRQDAIEAILAVTGNSSVRELYEHVQEHGLSDMWSGGVNAAIDIIIAVPSAQSEPCEDDPRADVYHLAEKIGIHRLYALVVELRGEPEIIRCKDCRYHISQDGRCRLWCQFVDPSEWCSRAVRKDGEADG